MGARNGAAGFNTGSAISGGAGAAGDAIASFYQASAEKRNLEVQAKWAALQAQQEGQRAVEASQRGAQQQFMHGLEAAQQTGAQVAAMAAGGGGESAARVIASGKFVSTLDTMQLQSNTDKEVWALRQSARAKMMDAQTLASNASTISPIKSVVASGFTSARKLADQWYAEQQRNPAPKLSKKNDNKKMAQEWTVG